LLAANPREALTEYRKALAILKKLAGSDSGNSEWQRDMTVVYSKMGDALIATGEPSDALAEYRNGLAILQKLASADSGNTEWQSDLSSAHTRVGSVLTTLGQRDEAVNEFRAAFAIDDRLATTDPQNARWQIDLVLSLWHLAADGGDDPRARYARALAILRGLEAGQKLTTDQQQWIPTIEQLLGQLPPEQAEAR
jgi:tetratricopeptide (TPR) repeat protein